jgi:hypothetical protein
MMRQTWQIVHLCVGVMDSSHSLYVLNLHVLVEATEKPGCLGFRGPSIGIAMKQKDLGIKLGKEVSPNECLTD